MGKEDPDPAMNDQQPDPGGDQGKDNGGWRAWGYRLALVVMLGLNGLAQYVLWFGDQGVVRWLGTARQAKEMAQEVRVAEERIRRLEEEILLVEKEPLVMEEVARRDLGLVYPDEILFITPEKQDRKDRFSLQ